MERDTLFPALSGEGEGGGRGAGIPDKENRTTRRFFFGLKKGPHIGTVFGVPFRTVVYVYLYVIGHCPLGLFRTKVNRPMV